MHQLWTYDGENAIQQWTHMIHVLKGRIVNTSPQLAQAWRAEINTYAEYLYDEQRELHGILTSIERDWERYMDHGSRDRYYQHLTELYLSIGGHWAGVQENPPLWERPEAYAERGRSKLFKA